MFRKKKPTTPSLRHTFIFTKNVNKKPLLKNKIKNFNGSLGKSKYRGIVTKRHKERGSKKKYRLLSSVNKNINLQHGGNVCSIEYDPYRSGFIMSVFDNINKRFFYFLAQENIKVGDTIYIKKKLINMKNGNSCLIKNVAPGTLISNVLLNRQKKGAVAKSAGSYCIVKDNLANSCSIEMPSGEIRTVNYNTYVTIGRVSNMTHFLEQLGKAGRSRWKGVRPKTRGVAMNPIDHPNGGGEGKKSGKGKTPWGQPGKRGSSKNRQNKF